MENGAPATNRSRHGTDMPCIIKREVVERDARACVHACVHADAPAVYTDVQRET